MNARSENARSQDHAFQTRAIAYASGWYSQQLPFERQRPVNRRDFHIATVSSIVLAATGRSLAQEEEDEYAVKVGYLYNFCNYVRWPQQVAPNAFTVGVLGPALKLPEAIATLRELNGQPVANRKIVLREFTAIEKYQPCDMVFVTGTEAGEPDLLSNLVKLTTKKPVLIVSEVPEGLKRGATINFVRVGKTVKLEIKQAAAKEASLVINAKLLRLAINADGE